jgi:hypothetical protein
LDLSCAIARYRHDVIDDAVCTFDAIYAVAFAHTDDMTAVRGDDWVGKADCARYLWLFGERRDFAIEAATPQTLVDKIREIDHTLVHCVALAPVFVHGGTSAEWDWQKILGGPVGSSDNNHLAPLLRWSAFVPEDVFVFDNDLRGNDNLLDEEFAGDRRFPRTVRSSRCH